MMTPAERKRALTLIYRHTSKDYKGRINGRPTILTYREGTVLVYLDDLTEAEIARDLPMAERKEAARLARKRKPKGEP